MITSSILYAIIRIKATYFKIFLQILRKYQSILNTHIHSYSIRSLSSISSTFAILQTVYHPGFLLAPVSMLWMFDTAVLHLRASSDFDSPFFNLICRIVSPIMLIFLSTIKKEKLLSTTLLFTLIKLSLP